MSTPTFNLPLINGASPISIVNDMNALANAVDSALAALKAGSATAADIERIRKTAEAAQSIANNAVTAAAKAQGAADGAQKTATSASSIATTANENASIASSNATAAKNAVDALTAILGQAASYDFYNFGSTGYVRASAPGVTYNDWNWEWCNGVLRFNGRENISGTLPADCITLPAGAAKPKLKTGATGIVTLGYGSIGNDSGRNLCEIHYDTKTEILSLYTPYLRTSVTPVFIDASIICGMDLSKL
jgi:hypothetical protein